LLEGLEWPRSSQARVTPGWVGGPTSLAARRGRSAFSAYLHNLDCTELEMLDANTDSATGGLESTYAKGCRCEPRSLPDSQARGRS